MNSTIRKAPDTGISEAKDKNFTVVIIKQPFTVEQMLVNGKWMRGDLCNG